MYTQSVSVCVHIHEFSERAKIACVPKEIPLKGIYVDLFLFNVALLLLHKLQQKMVSALNQARISTFEHKQTQKNAVFSCWTFVPIAVDAPLLPNTACGFFFVVSAAALKNVQSNERNQINLARPKRKGKK